MIKNNVLIAEGENPVVLPILRTLAQKGLNVAVITNIRRFSLSSFSKYCSRRIFVPSIALEREYIRAVEKIVRSITFEVLFPIFEWSLIPISKNRDVIGRYVKLPIASHESILKCFDKSLTIKLALENDVPIPKTFFVRNLSQLKKVAKKITYPAVVKPRWSMVWQDDRAFYRRCGFVNSPRELIITYQSIHKYFPFPLIQEYVPGVNYSVASLYNEGKPKAFCCIKVHRAWPPTGGNSCFRETVKLNPTMKAYTEKLLEALNWHGIAEVEFRLDLRDNTPRLMEINPRFWGSLCVAMKAGVDFPYLLYRMAVNGDVNSVFNYKIGVKGRYFDQDLLYIISILKNTSNSPILHNGKRLKVLLNWLKLYEPGVFYDLFEWDDPLPFLFSTALSSLRLLKYLKEKKNYAWSQPTVLF